MVVTCAPLQRLEVLRAEDRFPAVDWVAITSPRTVTALRRLEWRIPDGMKLAAAGPEATEALEQDGYHVDLVPPELAGPAALLEAFPAGTGRVIVPGSALSWPRFITGLQSKGWDARLLPVYTMPVLDHAPEQLSEQWRNGEFDAVVVTSGSAVLAFGKLLGWLPDIPVIAVGESAAAVLDSAGIGYAACTLSYDVASVHGAVASTIG